MDTVQAVLLIVIILLTILLLILGIQVFFILRSLKGTIMRANKVLENTEFITESVTEPISFVSQLMQGKNVIPVLFKILGLTGKKVDKKS